MAFRSGERGGLGRLRKLLCRADSGEVAWKSFGVGSTDPGFESIQPGDERVAFHRTLAAKRMGAGAVIRNGDGDVLIVKPTYKAGWELPGGAVEANESPAAACARELREELGMALPVGAMLCVDYNPTTDDYLESLMFLFDGGTIDRGTIDAIRLDPSELAEYRFVPLDEAAQRLVSRAGRRLRAVMTHGGTAGAYFEDQQPVPEPSAGRPPPD